MQRREFLSLTAKSLSFLALNELLSIESALASVARPDQFFVQISLPGGWDVTLGTDPWLKSQKPNERDMFIEYDPSSIVRHGQTAFGPSMLPMMPYVSNMAVINGIFLSANDNGHQAAEQYILSGSVNQNWGSMVVEYNECRGEGFLGILNSNGTSVGSRSPRLTPISSLSGLSLAGGDSFQSGSSRRSRLEEVASGMQDEAQKFARMKEIIDGFKAQGVVLGQGHYMAAAMSAGLAQTASYMAEGAFLDTHSGHVGTHMASQTTLWGDVAKLLLVFKDTPWGTQGESLFDKTTFFITSEFSRTAALNNAGGKDHNPLANSVVIVSPYVKNVTVGGSHLVTGKQSGTGSSYHISSPIDLQSGQVLSSRQNAFIIRPENIAATVAELLGISRKRFAPVGPKVPSLTHLIRR